VVHTWYHIAKAEYFVSVSGMRKHRKLFAGAMFTIAALWAVVLAPMIVGAIIGGIIPMPFIRNMLMSMFPGVMRAAMMLLWAMLLLYPLSNALQEVKIGQWEIMLSHAVRTRDILIGTYLGKIPLYGLLVLAFAPILITPFMLAFEVSLFGQLLVYTVIALMVLSTIWLSNFITALIQARLGQSARGNDIAKALAILVAVIVILPMYGLMYYLPVLSQLLGMNVFLLMPFAWTADLISWITIGSNGIGLTESQIAGFSSVLQIDALTSAFLIGVFGLIFVAVGLLSADRIFTIGAGVRTEKITTVGRDNLLLRGIRKVSKGPFGELVTVSLKSFGRKAENLSKVFYGIVLATILPIMVQQLDPGTFDFSSIALMLGMMIGILGVFPFAGTGFLESKDQLWMIQSAPKGASHFMRARLVSGLLIAVPLALVPTTLVAFMFGMTALEFLLLLVSSCLIVWGAVMVSMGITARNPNYEDTKSPGYQTMIMGAMMLTVFSVMAPILLDLFSFLAGISVFDFLESAFGTTGLRLFMIFSGPVCVLLVGALMMNLGVRSLTRPE
jgi:hypothetical protein